MIHRSLLAAVFAGAVASSPAFAADGTDVPDCGLYLYRAEIVRVIDGDTIVADIDLGFRTWLRDEHLRLYGIDTPELRSDEGKEAAQALRLRIEGKTLYICTIKAKRSDAESTGSFGRYLVVVYENGENINDWLLATGRAEPFKD